MRLEIVKLDNNYERWRRVGKVGVFKEDKCYLGDYKGNTDTNRDVKIVAEIPERNNTLCKWASLMTRLWT